MSNSVHNESTKLFATASSYMAVAGLVSATIVPWFLGQNYGAIVGGMSMWFAFSFIAYTALGRLKE